MITNKPTIESYVAGPVWDNTIRCITVSLLLNAPQIYDTFVPMN